MPGADHLPVDPVQQIRREQAQVVLQGLQFVVGRVVPVAVAQHLADALVLVGQVVEAVVVGVQAQPQHAQHQDVPLRHARPAGVRAGLARPVRLAGKDFCEDGKHALAQIRRGVEVLQTPQQLVDVVAGFRVEDEVGDAGQSKLALRVADDAHGGDFAGRRFCGLPSPTRFQGLDRQGLPTQRAGNSRGRIEGMELFKNWTLL